MVFCTESFHLDFLTLHKYNNLTDWETFQQQWLYDEKSDVEKVMETLDTLMEKLQVCSQRDKQIREWQKIFKVN